MQLTAENLRAIADYDPITGQFRWKQKLAQRVHVGERFGTVGPDNSRIVSIFGKRYQLHRLAVLWMTGKWPPHGIDHINRDRSDNRWCNLRLATQAQNCANSTKWKSKRLPKGVSLDRSRYRARISHDAKTFFLGSFQTADEAQVAYATAKNILANLLRSE